MDNTRRGDTRLRGGARSTTTIDVSHPRGPAQAASAAAAAAVARAGGKMGGGEAAGPRSAREGVAALVSAVRGDEPTRENRAARGAAQGVQGTIKQGVRQDEGNG